MYYDTINAKPTSDLYQYGDDRPVQVRPNLRMRNLSDLYKEYTFNIVTDQFGFRREKTDPLRPSLIILGDSMTFGYTVSNEEAYPNILDKLYPACQVVNAGKPGAG
ncbi:MAG: hypothetical protein Q8R20_01720, partial [Nanoarchaeota archaeon]|nr:hypothetical protein [Nanoarchaeota archaeon]